MFEKPLRWLENYWWGIVVAWSLVFISVYLAIWAFIEPLGIPDVLSTELGFAKSRVFYHILSSLVASAYITLTLEVYLRKKVWFGDKESKHKIADLILENKRLTDKSSDLEAKNKDFQEQILVLQDSLSTLGVKQIYNRANDTTLIGLQEAEASYWWYGMSAYYVLCSPELEEEHIEKKPETEYLFITIDPDCSSAIKAQAAWQKRDIKEVIYRINSTRDHITRLKEKGVNITWECHSSFPTFRIIAINKKKIFVSFYEQGKTGPEAKQIELDAKGLLGYWFLNYFEKSRYDARRIKLNRKISRYLYKELNTNGDQLLIKFLEMYSTEDKELTKEIFSELK
ncbi:MAG: hypothetical protein ABI977_12620 [Acidobacteriota bacterium]